MASETDLSVEERQLFTERIARSLDERPLGLPSGAHREAVASLIGRVGAATFYELLGVAPGASQVEIHDAYERLGRIVHPRHAGSLGIAGHQGVLELLLDRATSAYLTLSHPDRRRAYDRELGSRPWQAESFGEAREEEQRQVARRYFARANLLAAQEEYHQAIDLLRQAAVIDPKAEYYALLGQLEAKNALWLRRAEGNLERALELGGPDSTITATLTKVRELMEAQSTGAQPQAEISERRRPFKRRRRS